jgi:hypothetical protein
LTTFSDSDLSQLHAPAAFLPHEQVASAAHEHAELLPLRPQHVFGTEEMGADMMMV